MMNIPTTNLLLSDFPTKCDTTVSSTVTGELLQQKLKDSKEWKEVALLCDGGDFGDAPEEINKNFALSFLAQTSSLISYPESFLPVFIGAIHALGLAKLPQ